MDVVWVLVTCAETGACMSTGVDRCTTANLHLGLDTDADIIGMITDMGICMRVPLDCHQQQSPMPPGKSAASHWWTTQRQGGKVNGRDGAGVAQMWCGCEVDVAWYKVHTQSSSCPSSSSHLFSRSSIEAFPASTNHTA